MRQHIQPMNNKPKKLLAPEMKNYIDHSFQTPFGEIATRTWGNGSKKLFAIHGWLDNLESFTPLAQELSEEYQLICIDLPGHGQSYHHQDKLPYHFIDYPLHLAFILKELDFKGTIIGHSMGAAIAILLTANFPEHCEHVILLDGIVPIFTTPKENAKQLRKAFDTYNKTKKKPRQIGLETAIKLRRQVNQISYESAKLLCSRNLNASSTWSYDSLLKTPSPLRFTREQAIAYLQAIECPVTIIEASESQLINKTVESLKHHFQKKVDIHSIEGHHHAHMDQVQELVKLIKSH